MKRRLPAIRRRIQYELQQENTTLTYEVQWAGELNTAISTSSWSSEDSGVTIAGAASSGYVTSANISASPGCYTVVNQVVTTGGETDERIFVVTVVDNSIDTQSSTDYVE